MERIKLNIQLFADGKVTIDTDLNDSGFKKGLDKMQDIAKVGFKAIATSVGAAATAITGLIGKSVQAAGELEQQIGGTEAVFGKFADTVQKKAAGAFETMGVSANDFMATANKMGALMQGSGISIEDSMKMSTDAMQRAADIASIMGIDIGSAMESIAGAAKGNFTMMDNLGVAMNATTIEAYAMSKGIETSYNEMDNATKIGLAMEMFMEKTAYAEGNYTKENETFAGSFNTLKAAFSNFLSGAGGIEDVSKALVGFSKILVKSIGEMAPSITKGLVDLIHKIIPEIPPLIQSLLPTVLDGAISLINGLIEIFPAIVKLIKDNMPIIVEGAVKIVETLINALLEMLPDILEMGIVLLMELIKGIAQALPELIPTMVKVILDMVDILLDNIDLLIECGIQLLIGLTRGIFEALPELIARIPEIIFKIITALLAGIPEIVSAAIRLMSEFGLGLIGFIPELVYKIPEILKSLYHAFMGGIEDFKNIGKNLINGLWNGITEKWNSLKQKAADFADGITGMFKKVFGIHSPSKVFADQIGKQLSAGIGVGFEDELDNVYNDMQKAVDLETAKMSANVQTSGTYQMAMAGIPEFNLLDNTSNTTQLVVNGKVLAEVVNTENRNREVARV